MRAEVTYTALVSVTVDLETGAVASAAAQIARDRDISKEVVRYPRARV